MALFCIGEIGRKTDLSSFENVESVLSLSLENESDDLRQAASFALGALAVGNLTKYLHVLIHKIQVHKNEGKKLTLILSALYETISSIQKSNLNLLSQSNLNYN